MIVAGLRLGQVVKRYTGKRVYTVEERGVQQAGVGQHIHTAFIERWNATFRAHWAGLTDHIWSMDELLEYQVPWVPTKRRGRPKGSKNKPKKLTA